MGAQILGALGHHLWKELKAKIRFIYGLDTAAVNFNAIITNRQVQYLCHFHAHKVIAIQTEFKGRGNNALMAHENIFVNGPIIFN